MRGDGVGCHVDTVHDGVDACDAGVRLYADDEAVGDDRLHRRVQYTARHRRRLATVRCRERRRLPEEERAALRIRLQLRRRRRHLLVPNKAKELICWIYQYARKDIETRKGVLDVHNISVYVPFPLIEAQADAVSVRKGVFKQSVQHVIKARKWKDQVLIQLHKDVLPKQVCRVFAGPQSRRQHHRLLGMCVPHAEQWGAAGTTLPKVAVRVGVKINHLASEWVCTIGLGNVCAVREDGEAQLFDVLYVQID